MPSPWARPTTAAGPTSRCSPRSRERVELCLFDADGTETRRRPARGHRVRPPRLPARHPTRASATASGCTARGPRRRAPVQPPEAADRPLRQGGRRGRASGTRPCSPTRSTTGPTARRRRRTPAPFVPKSVVVNPYFDWGDDRHPRRPWHETVVYETHVKGLTQRHPDVPEDLRGTYLGSVQPADPRPPRRARRHRRRADAGAPVRPRPPPRRAGPAQLLGLQLHRLPRAAQRVRRVRPAGPAGAGVQADGQDPPRGRHRGDPRRRLQPHRRGQRRRAAPVAQGHRQRRPTTGSTPTTRGATSTTPAPATASTCATRTCCS